MRAPAALLGIAGGLTTRGRALLAGAAGAGAGAVLVGEHTLVAVAVLLAALPVVSAAVLARTRVRLTSSRQVHPAQIRPGGVAQVRIEIRNDARVPTSPLLAEDSASWRLGGRPRFVLPRLGPGETRAVTYQLTGSRRGRHRVGPLTVRLTDPFGCCELARDFPGAEQLTVTPVVHELPLVPLGATAADGGPDEPLVATGSGETDLTVRSYRRGDDLRRVHWRSTARTGELMVRREGGASAGSATLLLDDRAAAYPGSGTGPGFEWVVSAAASVAVHLTRRGLAVRLVTGGTEVGATAPGLAEALVLGALAVVEPSGPRRPRHRAPGGVPGRPATSAPSAWSAGGTRRTQGAVVVAIGGLLYPAEAAELAGSAQRAGGRIAVLLDPAPWGLVGPGAPSPLASSQALLLRAGWRVLVAGPGDELATLWAQLRGPARISATAAGWLAVVGTATSLRPLFDSWGFLAPVAVAAALVAATAAVARAARHPGLAPVLAVLAVLEYLTVLDARGSAVGGVLPGPAALATLRGLARTGLSEVRTFAAPVPARDTLVLLAVVALAGLALVVDLVGVTGRRPGAAGLALLLLVVVPGQVRGTHATLLPVVLGGAGWLALLAAEEHRRLAGTRPAGPAGPGPAPPPTSAGWRIAAATLGLAVLVPVALPHLADHSVLAGSGGLGPGSGTSSVTVVQPLVTVEQQLHDPRTIALFTVRTTHPTYLRLTALDSFDGTTFSLAGLGAGPGQRVTSLPRPPGDLTASRVSLSVSVGSRFAEHYLPLPYAVTSVQVGGDWRLDRPTWTVFSTHTDTLNTRYTATAALPDPGSAQLAATGRFAPGSAPAVPGALARDVALPTGSQYLRQLALQVAGAAGARTWFQAVLAIQDYLRGPSFAYSLDVPALRGPEALSTFLLVTRTGYCEQFATAMAALVRALGVPARVAVGFTPGSPGPTGRYLVTNHDAHAWPEVWFPSTGWLRFEPTPLDGGRALVPAYAAAAGAATSGGEHSSGRSAATSAAPAAPRKAASPFLDHRQAGTGTGRGAAPRKGRHSARTWPVVAAAAALVLLGLGPGGLRRLRRRRWAGAQDPASVVQAWSALLADAADLGVPVAPERSPRGNAGVLEAALPARAGQARAALRELLARVESARFALPTGGEGAAARAGEQAPPLGAQVALVRRELGGTVPPLRRWRAQLLPPSAWRALAGVIGAGGADALDWLDRLGSRWAGRLRGALGLR